MIPLATLLVAVLLVLIVIVPASHYYLFETLRRRILGGELTSLETCHKLERLASLPSLMGEGRKLELYRDLVRLLNHWGQPDRALVYARRILELGVDSAVETDLRIRMADALETLGRDDEAAEQRGLAKIAPDEEMEGKDATWFLNHGRTLEAERDFNGACGSYSKALALTSPLLEDARARVLIHLALAEFHAGRVPDSARHAEEAAEAATDPRLRLHGLKQASASFATMGELERSETLDRLACDLARDLGDLKALAESSAHLAENLRKRGRLRDAMEAVDEAARIQENRIVHGVRYEILRSTGRFEEALAELDEASRIGRFGLGRHENKMQAVYDFGAWRLLMELRRFDEAEARLRRAGHRLREDPKLNMWNLAACARMQAVRGNRTEARALMDQVEAAVPGFAADRNTLLVAYSCLGRAALVLEDFDRAIEAWKRYLEAPPSPVDEPIGLFYLGESLLGRGDGELAREAYRRAVARGLETHETKLAGRRLEESAR